MNIRKRFPNGSDVEQYLNMTRQDLKLWLNKRPPTGPDKPYQTQGFSNSNMIVIGLAFPSSLAFVFLVGSLNVWSVPLFASLWCGVAIHEWILNDY